MANFTSRFNELLSRASANDSSIAESLNVSKQTISAWKNGKRFPKKPALKTIANYFHVGVPWLEGVTDDVYGGMEPVDVEEPSHCVIGCDNSFYFFFGKPAEVLDSTDEMEYDNAVKQIFIEAINESLEDLNTEQLQSIFKHVYALKKHNDDRSL